MFKSRKLKKLFALLQESHVELNGATTGDVRDYSETGKVPCAELFDIYTRRQGTAGDKYSGFPELLRSLDQQGTRVARVHSFRLHKRSIFAFTDEATTELLGMLIEQ